MSSSKKALKAVKEQLGSGNGKAALDLLKPVLKAEKDNVIAWVFAGKASSLLQPPNVGSSVLSLF